MININISTLDSTPNTSSSIEVVERKGVGHPDTICDALAEELSQWLCRYYLEHCGLVLHHNVDKALLWGGSSRPAFNGGEIIAPMELFLAGRATCEFKGVRVPLDDIVTSCCENWLSSHFHALDVKRHVKIHSLIRPGSADLVDLYLRQKESGVALANDTSCGVGYAPLSELERLVLRIEKHLNLAATKKAHPEIGEDIKVMGVSRNNKIELTIACAFIDRHIADINDYLEKKSKLGELIKNEARQITDKVLEIKVNTADNPDTGSLYLTVTGTSAESGDDGEVGRGNRANGLITPYRPMNMEAVSGKNPVTHVGKLYNIVARQITEALVEEFAEVTDAYCYLVSQIGSPVSEPSVIDLKLKLHSGAELDAIRFDVEQIVHDRLSSIPKIRNQLLAGLLHVY
jgi:S-adenosylmethionine synthetase